MRKRCNCRRRLPAIWEARNSGVTYLACGFCKPVYDVVGGYALKRHLPPVAENCLDGGVIVRPGQPGHSGAQK